LKASIAGFASINYRLSPNPSHPKCPSSPDDPSRNVHYPAHLLDVAHALLYLEEKYLISSRYLLAGHSAGATMSFELHNWYLQDISLPRPTCVVGVAGIYHFEAFLEAHSDIPSYKAFMENAFPNRSLWERASPYKNRLPGLSTWEHARVVIISHSNEDELVEKAQASFMLERIQRIPSSESKVHFIPATGTHDEIWESGQILADLIIKSVRILRSSSSDLETALRVGGLEH